MFQLPLYLHVDSFLPDTQGCTALWACLLLAVGPCTPKGPARTLTPHSGLCLKAEQSTRIGEKTQFRGH